MPSTRSATKAKQTSLEDFKEGDKIVAKPIEQQKGKKRKADASDLSKSSSKNRKTVRKDDQDHPDKDENTDSKAQKASDGSSDKPIMINRSPVLQLWASLVASFLRPNLSFDPTCLSIGNAISALCAISKGKAIGTIQPKDKSADEKQAQRERKEKAEQESEEVVVMGFDLHVKQDVVLLDGKKKTLSEASLKSKFGGEEQYERARKTMQNALESWKGREDELNDKAFHMYETFRPTVPPGQSGWGRKAELDLENVKSTIAS